MTEQSYISSIQNKLTKNKLYIISSFIIYLLLSISYVFDLNKYFEFGTYLSFQFAFNIVKILSISILSILITVLGSYIRSDFTKTVWYIVLILQYFSSAILYTYCPNISFSIVLQNIILLIIIHIFDKINFNYEFNFKTLSIDKHYKILTILAFGLLLPFIYIYWPYITLNNLLLKDIYETRLIFRTINIPILGYLSSPLSRIIFPILLVYGIKKHKYILVIFSFTAILYIFLCSATKSVLIGGILAFFFYLGDKWVDKFKLFLLLIIPTITISFVLSVLFDYHYFTDAFVRRVFFVPPFLDNIYHQYFISQPTYWGHSPFGLGLHHLDYLNNESITRYVGERLVKVHDLNANIGILTEGYMSFGIIGVIIHSIAYAFIFMYLKLLKISPHYFGIIFAYIFYLNSSLLSTLLLTHGLIFLLIIFRVFLKNSDSKFK